jgi:hypothetical protein
MKSSNAESFLLGLAIALLVLSGCTGNKKPVEGLPWVPTDLKSAAERMNERCPEMVDPESRLDSVILGSEGLSFYYTLPNKDRSGIDSVAFKAFLIPGIVDNIQHNPRMKMFRDSSLVMFFNYRDRNGMPIAEFPIRPASEPVR